jgi:hypothetical protein
MSLTVESIDQELKEKRALFPSFPKFHKVDSYSQLSNLHPLPALAEFQGTPDKSFKAASYL